MGMAFLPQRVLASNPGSNSIEWDTFLKEMKKLADGFASGETGQGIVAEHGIYLLQQLVIDSTQFETAVNDAFESGNQYWLWQRMVKEDHINGGILNIDSDRVVQLHDHPGATGMLRIISGETEIWQFDQVASSVGSDGNKTAELKRVSRRVLKPGDTAVLTPDSGNIHALRAVSKHCSMLDLFIPPYQTSRRSWYEPIDKDWFNRKFLTCRSIPQYEYTKA